MHAEAQVGLKQGVRDVGSTWQLSFEGCGLLEDFLAPAEMQPLDRPALLICGRKQPKKKKKANDVAFHFKGNPWMRLGTKGGLNFLYPIKPTPSTPGVGSSTTSSRMLHLNASIMARLSC